MNLLVLGAAGPTGRLVVDLAVHAGDKVTALARHPAKLGGITDRVSVVAGDATSHDDVARALPGQDVIISALGRGRSVRSEDLFARAARAVVGVAEQLDVIRLVWLSSFGVGDTYRSATPMQKLMYRTLLHDLYANKEISERTIRASGPDWTLVYPTALMNGPAKGTYRVADRIAMRGAPRISRADVAAFMYKAARSPEWIHRDAVITD